VTRSSLQWTAFGTAPLRSSGRLSVSQLAIEASVKRWHLTHQHLDLKELFQARVQAAASTPKAFAAQLSEHEDLKDKHAKLIAHCADWKNAARATRRPSASWPLKTQPSGRGRRTSHPGPHSFEQPSMKPGIYGMETPCQALPTSSAGGASKTVVI
jgi:hypothetical protein